MSNGRSPSGIFIDACLLTLSGIIAGSADRLPPVVVVVALLIPAVWWCLRRVRLPSPFLLGAVEIPIAVLVAFVLPLSSWASADFAGISWSRVALLCWSILVCLTVSLWSPSRGSASRRADENWRPNPWSGPAFLGAAILAAVLGALSMRSLQKLAPFGAASTAIRSAGASLGLPVRTEPNLLAGAMTLVVPFAFVWTLASFRSLSDTRNQPRRWTGKLALTCCTGVLLLTLGLTQSRGGIAACWIALALAVLLLREWILLVVLLTSPLLGVLAIGPARLWGYVAYGGRLQISVLTGRPEIWERARQAISDVPFTGMGLGTFGSAMKEIYPIGFTERALAHAHSLYLDTAVGLGLPGLIVLLAIFVGSGYLLVRVYRLSPPRSLSRYWTVALAAGLIAHLLYSIPDAVPLGTAFDALLWFELGLILDAGRSNALVVERPGLAVSKRRAGLSLAQGIPFLALVALLSLIVVPLGAISRALSVNLASHTALEALMSDPSLLSTADERLAGVAKQTCRANWLRGLVEGARGDPSARDAVWRELVRCGPQYVALVRLGDPSNMGLAEAAVELQPTEAESLFWLGELLIPQAPDRASELYVRGLGLKPGDGRRWLQLGDLLAQTQPRTALDAYLRACENGDPGANGCYRAGRIAESLGDPQSAIRYYRMSRWSGATSRADRLEKRAREP